MRCLSAVKAASNNLASGFLIMMFVMINVIMIDVMIKVKPELRCVDVTGGRLKPAHQARRRVAGHDRAGEHRDNL